MNQMEVIVVSGVHDTSLGKGQEIERSELKEISQM